MFNSIGKSEVNLHLRMCWNYTLLLLKLPENGLLVLKHVRVGI